MTSTSPTNQTFNYRDTSIEVEFSLPVRSETVPAAFKVTPPVDGTFTWPTPTKMVFVPKRLLDQGETYLVTLESSITDTFGSERLEPTSWSFSTVKKYYFARDIAPMVNAHCLSCHRADGPAARISLASREDILRYVQPGDAERSSLLTALKDSNHQGKLSREAVAKLYLVRDWITLSGAE